MGRRARAAHPRRHRRGREDAGSGRLSGSEGRVHRLNVSGGGVPKRPVPEARVTRLGFEGDDVRHKRVHGGPDRAACVYALERLEALRREGHAVEPGSLGENLTLAGVDWALVLPGARIALGDEAVLEVTKYTVPCGTIAHCFGDGDSMRIHQERHPGWSRVYARVLAEGPVREGDAARVLPAFQRRLQ